MLVLVLLTEVQVLVTLNRVVISPIEVVENNAGMGNFDIGLVAEDMSELHSHY